MTFEKATAQDTGMLTELRIAYLQEDLGEIEAVDLELIESLLPGYYEKHLNRNLMVYVARNEKGYRFLCILVDRGKTYEPIIYYREDGDCFECLYEARV